MMPAEWDAILAEALAPQDFSPKSVTALINLRGLFSIGDQRVERAVELMRSAGHRFDGDVDQEMHENIFTGLAGVASASRNTALADELRVMVRKNRIDSAHPPKAQRSEEHTSELQSLMRISYAVFCLKKQKHRHQ